MGIPIERVLKPFFLLPGVAPARKGRRYEVEP